ncbi:glyoxalase domain-containing 4 [Brachionus plicatilis]|uniref:Glyoxalase domain-containing 4 n=1 Tax=Brachionus plicatilis TaxID=10195 RepID=A0A3M7SFW9_BRAPC|nr:glyoxalase domain-containing 4 [Brachionus plicatilis]
MPSNIRPLHFVFKIASRTKTIEFYRNVLKMKILRHEEFTEGCDAACNGPYDGKWSKTMIGYGSEDSNFVIELTYNYGIRSYERGNDFNYLKVESNSVFENIKNRENSPKQRSDGLYEIQDPDGYTFLVGQGEGNESSITALSLLVTNLEKSKNYWSNILKGKLISEDLSKIELSFDYLNFQLVLEKSGNEKIDHAKAYGRVAFSCPTEELKPLQSEIEKNQFAVLTPYIQLYTPGKATVSVVILADPDGHEICFVGDKEFRELSQLDPNGEKLLDDAMKEDKSDEWHEKKNKKK